MPMELDPRVRRFQEIKARKKQEAIARKAQEERQAASIAKIKEANPALTDKQALQVYEAHQRQQQARTIHVPNKHGKGTKTVKVFHA